MNCSCPHTNIQRLVLTTISGFVFIFAFDYLVHANVLSGIYAETAHLWRTPVEMKSTFPFMLAMQFLLALITSVIFTRNYEAQGIAEGIRFGSLLGVLFAVMMSSSYAWLPIPELLAIYWAMAGLMQGLGLGIIYSLTYKK